MQELRPYQHYCNRKEKRIFIVLDIHEQGDFTAGGKVIFRELKDEPTEAQALPIFDFQHMIEKRQLEFFIPKI